MCLGQQNKERDRRGATICEREAWVRQAVASRATPGKEKAEDRKARQSRKQELYGKGGKDKRLPRLWMFNALFWSSDILPCCGPGW